MLLEGRRQHRGPCGTPVVFSWKTKSKVSLVWKYVGHTRRDERKNKASKWWRTGACCCAQIMHLFVCFCVGVRQFEVHLCSYWPRLRPPWCHSLLRGARLTVRPVKDPRLGCKKLQRNKKLNVANVWWNQQKDRGWRRGGGTVSAYLLTIQICLFRLIFK